jgi:tRNA-dihydrouridine synthase B
MGSHADEIAEGAKILVGLGYDVIDVNLACPVKKIRRKCRGGHLLSSPDEAIAILDAVRQAVGDERPCTVKLRRGSDDSADAESRFHRIFEKVIKLGYAAAVVHGRTVEQKYVGPARWSFLTGLVAQYGEVPNFTIGGSGDIWTCADIFSMLKQTGVKLVSVARGCIGNPWIFAQARAALAGDEDAAAKPPSIADQRRVLLEHFEHSVRIHGERSASRMMRKFGIKFARHHPADEQVAKAFIDVSCIAEWRQVLDRFYVAEGATSVEKERGHEAA